MRDRRNTARDTARRVLWTDREDLLPHLLEHRCHVTDAVIDICETACWTFESFLLAALFDREELIVEVTA
jgi:hypothetical protein